MRDVQTASDSTNPYQSPTESSELPATPHEGGGRYSPSFIVRLAWWWLICFTCGAPSFFVASAMIETPYAEVTMISCVAALATAYAVFDLCKLRPIALANSNFRRAMRTGFAIRILVSVVFPIGLMVDIFTGMTAMHLANSFFVLQTIPHIVVTVFAQAILMNFILWAGIGVIYLIMDTREKFRAGPITLQGLEKDST